VTAEKTGKESDSYDKIVRRSFFIKNILIRTDYLHGSSFD
jgi:hypothetical protein